MVAGAGTFMYTDGDYLMKSIDFDNAYKEPQIKLDDAVRNIDMSVITYAEDTFDQVLNTAVTVRGKAKVFLEYQKPIISTSAQINITGAKSHTTLKNYDSGIEMEIVADGEVVIVISGKTLAANTTVYTLSNPTIKEGTTLLVENPLINTPELALEVGSWLASEFAARAVYSISWRQNPALECGDIVLIEDSYGNKKQSRITKQEYTFQGYLRGSQRPREGYRWTGVLKDHQIVETRKLQLEPREPCRCSPETHSNKKHRIISQLLKVYGVVCLIQRSGC